jgi:hypothetical protein
MNGYWFEVIFCSVTTRFWFFIINVRERLCQKALHLCQHSVGAILGLRLCCCNLMQIPCPLCNVLFPLEQIEVHADQCTGEPSGENSGVSYYDVDNDEDIEMVYENYCLVTK